MDFKRLLEIVGQEPVFRPGLLLAGPVSGADVRRQLSRWTRSGRIVQLRRGLYMLGEPYRKAQPHPFLAANLMKRASYVSLQSALRRHGLIPEDVPAVTSVTTGRPEKVSNPLGDFIFKHVKPSWFSGYGRIGLGRGQEAFVAEPEKALLDLIYLTPGADGPDYLDELRLQNLHALDPGRLLRLAGRSGSARVIRAAKRIEAMIRENSQEES